MGVESGRRLVLGCGYRYETKERMKKADFHEWIGASERMADLTVSSEGATRQKAADALDGLSGRDLVNAETGIKAQINGDQKRKIVSNAALDKSHANGFSPSQHFAVAAKIDKAWENASLVEEREDRARDVNIASIKRFVAPLLLDGEMATAYLTIKESMEHGHRIYSLELQEIKIPTV